MLSALRTGSKLLSVKACMQAAPEATALMTRPYLPEELLGSYVAATAAFKRSKDLFHEWTRKTSEVSNKCTQQPNQVSLSGPGHLILHS